MKPGESVQIASARLQLALAFLIAITAAAPARAQQRAKTDSTTADSLLHLSVRDIGPPVGGGRVSAVVGVPGKPDIYYIGAAAGGVWKTTNAGNSWTPVFEHEPVASIGAIALAPSNANLVWVGTGEANIRNDVMNGRGVYFSPDAGQSWSFMGLQDAGQIGRIVVDPSDPNTVFVAALGHAWTPNAERGVFKTTDGGKTWKKVLFVNDTTGAVDIVMQPGNPRVLFAAMWQVHRFPWELVDGGAGSGIYRSTDGGDTWKKLTNGLPNGPLGRIALAVAPSDPQHVYALIEAKQGLLWESHDMGDRWTKVSDNHAIDVRPFYFSQINVAPNDENHLFFSSFQLMESTDGGKTAHSLDSTDVHPDHHALWIDPDNAKRMIQGNDGGVYTTTDGGETWNYLDNLPIEQFYMVAADNNIPYDLCGGLQDNSAWCGPSNSLRGSGITGAEWRAVTGGDGEYAVPAPNDSSIIYVDSQNGFVTRLDLRTGVAKFIRPYLPGVEEKSPAELKYRFNWTSPIAVSRTNANTVYLGANVLFKSTDGGATWTVISPDLTNNDKSKQHTSGGPIEYDISGAETYNTILSITLAPSDSNVIWIGTDDGNVQVTRDGGAHWTNVRPHIKGLPAEGRIDQVGVSPYDAGTAYIAIDYHEFNNERPYVFKTTNYGASWTPIASGLPDNAAAIVVREDPNQKGFLVLGTDEGLWYSSDDGAHWNSLAASFPTAPVFDVKFVRGTHDLAVATHGRGVFVIDDITPLEQLTAQIRNDSVHVFSVQPATMLHRPETDVAVPSRYSAPNPSTGALINYWLESELKPTDEQKKLDETPVAITVTSAKGDTIFTGHGPSKQGLNRFAWNLHYSGPTKLTIAKPTQGEFGESNMGPSVLPGTYTVAVTVKGRTHSRQVAVHADPRLPFDTAAARAQLAAALQLRNEISAMNEMLNGLHSLRTQITNLEQVVKENAPRGAATQDSTVVKAATDLEKKLAALQDTIYNPHVQRGAPEDDIHYLTRFYDQLRGMTFAVTFPYDEAPNELTRNELADMRKQLDDYLNRYNTLVRTDVAAFNKMAAQHGAPALVGGPTVDITP